MGTSTSFRAPPVPRWQAFTTALQMGMPLDRLQSELFNAGREWEEALSTPAVAVYATVLLDIHESFPDKLRVTARPEQALQQLASEARTASDAQGGSAATAMAERAFIRLLTRATAGDASLSQAGPDEAANRFRASRGSPGDLVTGYVGELLGQYARYATAREAGRLTEGKSGLTVAATRRLTGSLAAAAEQIGRESRAPAANREAIESGWRALIRDAFARGRTLPESGQ